MANLPSPYTDQDNSPMYRYPNSLHYQPGYCPDINHTPEFYAKRAESEAAWAVRQLVLEELPVEAPRTFYDPVNRHTVSQETPAAVADLNELLETTETENVLTNFIDEDSFFTAYAAKFITGDSDVFTGNFVVQNDGTVYPIDFESDIWPPEDVHTLYNKIHEGVVQDWLGLDEPSRYQRTSPPVPSCQSDVPKYCRTELDDNIRRLAEAADINAVNTGVETLKSEKQYDTRKVDAAWDILQKIITAGREQTWQQER